MQPFRFRPGSRRTPSPLPLLLVTALAACSLGCEAGTGVEPAGAEADRSLERFQFVRAARVFVRMDSMTGQTWFVPHDAEGGWAPLGMPAEPEGGPTEPGRYRIYNLEAGRRAAREPTQRMLRVDGDTGRTWTIELRDGARWSGIDDPNERSPRTETTPAATPPTAPTGQPATGQPTTAADLGVVPRETIALDEEAASDFAKNLVQALEKDGMPPGVQAWSARQLGQFPREVAVRPLLAALESEHPDVVVAAIHALKETGDPTAIPSILRLENHPDPTVRAAVQEVVVEVQ